MRRLGYLVIFGLALVLSLAMITGCDNSCDTEGDKQCAGTTLQTCKSEEWDGEDCFDDVCEPNGYASGSCVDNDDGKAYCECGY